MSPKEQAIADAALREYPAADQQEAYEQIAEYAGYPVKDVVEIMSELVTDWTLTALTTPVFHPTPQIEGEAKIVQAWFVKGRMWGTPRRSLHS